ncbi:MAG: tRNA (adenosine(37)-N6)-threonylcarbamoyltransferase complex ATPase subunit type 1 TsaE [marine benthic group bacterium]|nr:tRNA (adenosine(37)-N6)-threonylcarbamoyltransferase complex ATPase subunit type 1 TsaE [Candidatus Benthicola marisminoris]
MSAPTRAFELTEPALESWGRAVGRAAAESSVFVCLYGELGAGKSTLARAACRGAGVMGPVPSPTFTLVNQYHGKAGLVIQHSDLYRIEAGEALRDMGWEDLLWAEGPVFVEWADRAEGYLPEDRWDIHLGFVSDPSVRRVVPTARGGAPPIPEPEHRSGGC